MTRHQRFTRVRLLEPHLTEFLPPFPTTLTTRALYPRSLWRFGTCPCRPIPEGLPPSSIKLRRTSCRGQTSTAHDLLVFEAAPQPLDEDVIHTAPLPVHADRDSVVLQSASEVVAGELAALVGIEDLGPTVMGE